MHWECCVFWGGTGHPGPTATLATKTLTLAEPTSTGPGTRCFKRGVAVVTYAVHTENCRRPTGPGARCSNVQARGGGRNVAVFFFA